MTEPRKERNRPWRYLVLLLSLVVAAAVRAADEPALVARWDFGTEESTPLAAHGGVQRDQAGPRPPEFPDFADNNTAVRLDGKGARLSVPDAGPNSPFDFGQGDAITLEAWVQVQNLREGQPVYVIGKGRTGSPRFLRDNQNWALRLVGGRGEAHLSFLFATKLGSGDSHWHRWTSLSGFATGSGWRHVAVTYRFGEPKSIRGWIDGQPTDGKWDMGGATSEPPVVDDDEIWIGSSLGGNPSNSFDGWLDAVAVYRTLVDDSTMRGRFRRVGEPRLTGPQPEVMPPLGDIPEGRVLVTLAEKMPTHQRWLNQGEDWPQESLRWLGDEFLLPRIPQRFDSWGIRDSWQAPVLLRMAADVDLPAGPRRILLRARALGRLWIDGKLVARTAAMIKQPPNGEEPITPLVEPRKPGMRLPGYRQQEVVEEVEITADKDGRRRCRVVLELVVGGQNLRTETGEVCVALETDDGYSVLVPSSSSPLPLTDANVGPVLARLERFFQTLEDHKRRQAATSQDAFWNNRHQVARQWVELHPGPKVPKVSAATLSNHPIDAFLQQKISDTLAAAERTDVQQAQSFHRQVLPILREHCFRCHGDKDKGGLKLNSRDRALKGGDSEVAAVVPGDPAASELMARVRTDDDSVRMPPTGKGLSAEQISILEQWIRGGANWPAPPLTPAEVSLAPRVSDEAFLRRIYLDVVGVPPSADEAAAFLRDPASDKRERLIDDLLRDERYADHWISFWLDLLAENPTLLNASLNSTGPFRFFLWDALRDNKPLDRLVTELLQMRGNPHEGGSAGFAIAAENDAPLAAKAHIAASAFLGIELQCARCHDSPYHSTTQRDLYSLAAMLERQPVTVPATSRVPAAFFERKARESLIRVTLKPAEPVLPAWPFAEVTGVVDGPAIDGLMIQPGDSRNRLATLITAPQNTRFPRVIVNRFWRQLLGAGIVEPVYDWEGREASHPELLDWLAQDFVMHDYDLRKLIRRIVTSQVYQREASGNNRAAPAAERFFAAPDRRRLTAEQIVDSLHAATGVPMQVEELTFVHDGRRPLSNRLTLGCPTRAWMFASLNNERDRPSLSLPRARTEADVLEAFGWTGSRQKPVTERETEPNVLQPGILANGVLTDTLTRAAAGSELAQLAVDAKSAEELVQTLFLRVLNRYPQPAELQAFAQALADRFAQRLVPESEIAAPPVLPPLPLVTWFNHLQPEANSIQQEVERRVRRGPPPDPRLRAGWREVYEDVVWSLVNHREFVWVP